MIAAALSAHLVQRVIVSTDHPEIARIARECGAEVPFIRPADIAEDVASERVTQHAVRYLETTEHYPVGIALTMQPTTPFLYLDDVDGCVRMLIDSDADSAISACEVHERPEWMFYCDADGNAGNFRSSAMTGILEYPRNFPGYTSPTGEYMRPAGTCCSMKIPYSVTKSNSGSCPGNESVDIDDPIRF